MSTEPRPGVPPRVFAALWLTLCLNMVGFGILLPVLPFHAERLGASPAQIALLAACFPLAQLFAAPLLGRLGDRVGRRRVLLTSVAGACTAMLLLCVAPDLWVLFAARLLAGTCGGSVATAQAYVADHAPPGARAGSLGRLGAATGVGFVLGPALGGLLATPAWPTLPFAVAAALGGLNLALAWRWLPESRRPREAPRPATAATLRTATPATLRRLALAPLVLLDLAFFAAFAAMESTFALLLQARLAWGAWESGLLFTWIGVVIVVAQGVLVGRVVRRLGEPATLRLGLALLAAGLAAIGLATHAAGLAIAAATVAIANGLVSPALHAMISRRAPPQQQGLHLGVAASAASLGRVLGPLAAGVAFEAIDPGAPALLGALLVATLAVTANPRRLAPGDPARADAGAPAPSGP